MHGIINRVLKPFYVIVWARVSAISRTRLIFVPQWTKIDSNTLLELILQKEIINESSGNYYPNHEYFSKILHQHMPQKKPNRGFQVKIFIFAPRTTNPLLVLPSNPWIVVGGIFCRIKLVLNLTGV